jgi:hypothetical protein
MKLQICILATVLIIFNVSPFALAQVDEMEILKKKVQELEQALSNVTSELKKIREERTKEQQANSLQEGELEPVKLTDIHKGKIEQIEGRLDEVEQHQVEELTRKGQLSAFHADKIKFGGFIDTLFNGRFGYSTPTEGAFDSEVVLQVAADVTEKLRAVTATFVDFRTNFIDQHSPFRTNNGVSVVVEPKILFGEYRFKDQLILKAGRFTAPFGIINQEFFSPQLLRHDLPQIVRGFTVFDTLPSGVQLYGTYPIRDSKVGYNAYAASLSSNTTDVGGGGRLFYSSPNELLTVGVSSQTGERGSQLFSALGSDLKLNWRNFVLRTEYLWSFLDSSNDQNGFYVQPALKFFKDKLILFGQIDYLNDTLGIFQLVDHDRNPLTPSIADPFKKFEYTAGINYLPWPFLRNRLEFTWNNYVGSRRKLGSNSRDYFGIQASSTLSF